jgi:hypothetical protein
VGGEKIMIRISWSRLLTAFFVCAAAYSVLGGALAASKHTQAVEGLDRLIPREKWAGAGLDKLTAAEQQTLADDITSLLTSAPTRGSGAVTAKDRTPWRKLQRHMTRDDVRKLLGEPETVSVSRFYESWYYAAGSVTFDGKGRLDLWTED